MTEAQLLADLAARDQVDWVGTPETAETKPDGTLWRIVNYREVLQDVSNYRNQTYYVVDPGGAGEAAYYKDEAPWKATVRRSQFREWIKGMILANEDDFRGVSVHAFNEETEEIVFTILEISGTAPNQTMEQKTVWLKKGSGLGQIPITGFDPNLSSLSID